MIWTSGNIKKVALRKESVDRNLEVAQPASDFLVALRKESVDRNKISWSDPPAGKRSLSARRAWIEIVTLCDRMT